MSAQFWEIINCPNCCLGFLLEMMAAWLSVNMVVVRRALFLILVFGTDWWTLGLFLSTGSLLNGVLDTIQFLAVLRAKSCSERFIPRFGSPLRISGQKQNRPVTLFLEDRLPAVVRVGKVYSTSHKWCGCFQPHNTGTPWALLKQSGYGREAWIFPMSPYPFAALRTSQPLHQQSKPGISKLEVFIRLCDGQVAKKSHVEMNNYSIYWSEDEMSLSFASSIYCMSGSAGDPCTDINLSRFIFPGLFIIKHLSG